MCHQSFLPRLLFGTVLATIVSLPALAPAQTLVGFSNESRTVFALRVGQAGLQ
jgi:hypothetical protein